MANYPALANEVKNDPRGIGFSSMTPAQIVASLNTPNIAVTVPIPPQALLIWGAQNGRLDAIEKASTGASTAATRAIALAATKIILQPGAAFDYSNSTLAAMPTALVNAAVITQSDADALKALSQTSVSWAKQNWGRNVTLTDLHIAGV